MKCREACNLEIGKCLSVSKTLRNPILFFEGFIVSHYLARLLWLL